MESLLEQYIFHSLISIQPATLRGDPVQCFMSAHIGAILDKNNNKNKIYYTNSPSGLCTINLTIEILISVLYKVSLVLLQSVLVPVDWGSHWSEPTGVMGGLVPPKSSSFPLPHPPQKNPARPCLARRTKCSLHSRSKWERVTLCSNSPMCLCKVL